MSNERIADAMARKMHFAGGKPTAADLDTVMRAFSLTARDVSMLLRISERNVRRYRNRGGMPAGAFYGLINRLQIGESDECRRVWRRIKEVSSVTAPWWREIRVTEAGEVTRA